LNYIHFSTIISIANISLNKPKTTLDYHLYFMNIFSCLLIIITIT